MADNLGKLQQRVEKIRKKQGKMGEKMDKKMDKKIKQSENRTFELAAKPCCRGGDSSKSDLFCLASPHVEGDAARRSVFTAPPPPLLSPRARLPTSPSLARCAGAPASPYPGGAPGSPCSWGDGRSDSLAGLGYSSSNIAPLHLSIHLSGTDIVRDEVPGNLLPAEATTAPTATTKEDFFVLYERCVEEGLLARLTFKSSGHQDIFISGRHSASVMVATVPAARRRH